MRSCGDCAACCEGWLHDESLDMNAGKACKHCTGNGCGIYDSRPEVPCRTFRCAWLKRETDFDDDMRPDRCGAILIDDRAFKQWEVIRVIPVGVAVPDATLQRVMTFAAQNNFSVTWTERRTDYVDYPDDVRVGTAGSEEFTIQMKWEVNPGDVWRYAPDSAS